MRQKEKFFTDKHSDSDNSDPRYTAAHQRVKKMKGFYVHFFVFILVNAFLLGTVYNQQHKGADFWQLQNFIMTLCWGIGLAGHAFSVFGHRLLFGEGWQERKIRQLMEKERKQQNWE